MSDKSDGENCRERVCDVFDVYDYSPMALTMTRFFR